MNIQIININQINHAFAKAPQIMNEELRQALNKSAAVIQTRSILNAPRRTGYLKSSHLLKQATGQGLSMKAEVGPTANYAIFVHEGTRFQRAQPFLRDAVDASLIEVTDLLQSAVQNTFNRIGLMV